MGNSKNKKLERYLDINDISDLQDLILQQKGVDITERYNLKTKNFSKDKLYCMVYLFGRGIT